MQLMTCEPRTPTASRRAKLFSTVKVTAGTPPTESDVDTTSIGPLAASMLLVHMDPPTRDIAPMLAALDGAPVNQAVNRSTCYNRIGPSACIYAIYTSGTCLVSPVYCAATTCMTGTGVRKPTVPYTYGHFQVSRVPKVAPSCGHLFVHTPTNQHAKPWCSQGMALCISQLMFKAHYGGSGKDKEGQQNPLHQYRPPPPSWRRCTLILNPPPPPPPHWCVCSCNTQPTHNERTLDHTEDGDTEKNSGPVDPHEGEPSEMPAHHRDCITRLASEMETTSHPCYPVKLYKYATHTLSPTLKCKNCTLGLSRANVTHTSRTASTSTHGTTDIPSREATPTQEPQDTGTLQPLASVETVATIPTLVHGTPTGENMTTAINVICPECGMADFAYYLCSTCKYFAIHEPNAPDFVQLCLYQAMSPKTLYPRK